MDAGGVEARLAVKEEKKADEAALKHGEGHEEGVLAPEEGGEGAPEVGLAEQDTGVGERWSGEGGGGLGVPVFACTPDKFPDLMAVALAKQDVGMWLSKNIQ